nr:hypothetical protein [Actinospica robiniae]
MALPPRVSTPPTQLAYRPRRLSDCAVRVRGANRVGEFVSESQVHRQPASGLSMPVGFKNATDGDVQPAIDGCRTAAGARVFLPRRSLDDLGSAVRRVGDPAHRDAAA